VSVTSGHSVFDRAGVNFTVKSPGSQPLNGGQPAAISSASFFGSGSFAHLQRGFWSRNKDRKSDDFWALHLGPMLWDVVIGTKPDALSASRARLTMSEDMMRRRGVQPLLDR
jgi:hypothetical protein